MVSEPTLYNTGWIIIGYKQRRSGSGRLEYDKQLLQCQICHRKIQRRNMSDHVKYQNTDNMDNLIGDKEENMQDLPSREWIHSIWDRKCKRPECGDHKKNPTELRYHYRRAHPLDLIDFKDGDMNRCIKCGVI